MELSKEQIDILVFLQQGGHIGQPSTQAEKDTLNELSNAGLVKTTSYGVDEWIGRVCVTNLTQKGREAANDLGKKSKANTNP